MPSVPMSRYRWAAAIGGYALAAVGATWPLAANLDRLPVGAEDVATVPQLNLWTMEWNAHRLAAGLAGYWDAPIFHPTRGTFAFSDPQPLTGAVAAVVHVVVRDPVVVYGLVLLGALVLNGVGALVLTRRLGAPDGAAWATGLLAVVLPFVVHELGVLQLAMVFPFFFALAAVVDLRSQPGPGAGVRLGIWTGVAFLTSEYYGLFLLVLLALVVPAVLGRGLLRRAVAGPLLVAVGCAALLAAPLLVPQGHHTRRFRWSTETVTDNSASPADYGSIDPDALGSSIVPWWRDDAAEHLAPGTGLVVLAVAGFAVAWSGGRRRWAVVLGAAGLAVALLGFGLHLRVGGFSPYSVLRDHVAPFSRLRSPFRFAVVVQVLLVVLAAFALARLWRWRGWTGRIAVALVVTLTVAEGAVVPAALARPLPDFASVGWVRYLRAHRGGAVAMVPFPLTNAVESYEPTTEAMLAARVHGHPLVNGYSGLFPAQYFDLRAQALYFPDQGTDSMRVRGVRWVVVDRRWLRADPDRAREIAATPGLARAFADRTAVVYRLSAVAGSAG